MAFRTGTADVSGWSLTDIANHEITIPSGYAIPPGGTLRVSTGPGDSTADRYFDGRGQAIWNNSGGDTAAFLDMEGAWEPAPCPNGCLVMLRSPRTTRGKAQKKRPI